MIKERLEWRKGAYLEDDSSSCSHSVPVMESEFGEVTSTAKQEAVLRLTTVLDEPTLARKALIKIFISLSLVKLPRTLRRSGREAARVSCTGSSGRWARAARHGSRLTKYGRHWYTAYCDLLL